MTRIFPYYVYGDGPKAGCYWDSTCDLQETERLESEIHADAVIIGAGFTGLNAAISLAQAGIKAVVLEEKIPGWGASTRNGGFCCLGGSALSSAKMVKRFGHEATSEWHLFEKQAVEHVSSTIERVKADVDLHSKGETWLAHRARDMKGIEAEAERLSLEHGVRASAHSASDLQELGMSAGFHGGMTIPIGFGLNPKKYLSALVEECRTLGVQIFSNSAVENLSQVSRKWLARTAFGCIRAEKALIATNGYSSEHLPDWMAGRYMPSQSSVLVTRPLSDTELAAQGWTSDQMCYDSRNMLHYFRLMPNRRMLFGMRGGLGGTERSERRAKKRIFRDFQRMFPAWKHVESTHYWSGMVCLSRDFMPIVGEVPKARGLYCSLAYHGNGVAMASYCGHLIGQQMAGQLQQAFPDVLDRGAGLFPFGRRRRIVMPAMYAFYSLADL